jgi:hypothetical protein
MDTITLWLFLAFTVERVVELILTLVPRIDKKQVLGVDVPVLLSFVLALVLSFGSGLDFFQMVGVDFIWPQVGPVLSAIFMVGGSNVLHDILGWINAAKKSSRLDSY